MKKLSFILLGLSFLYVTSCSKDSNNEDLDLKKSKIVYGESFPVSEVEVITPWIIPGENNGGNITCEDIEAIADPTNENVDVTEEMKDYFKGASFDFCSDRVNYNEGGFFESDFPSGLIVTVVEDKFVSFKMMECIEYEGVYYKVGAVIVKGSNQANVYYYINGTMEDSGLASPENSSGSAAGLSNLTFCFVKCDCEPESEPEIIAAKLKYQKSDGNYRWATTENVYDELLFYGKGSLTSDNWCSWLGINETNPDEMMEITLLNQFGYEIGELTVEPIEIDNKDYFNVQVTLDGVDLVYISIFVGTETELKNTFVLSEDGEIAGCPDYEHDESWFYVQGSSDIIVPR